MGVLVRESLRGKKYKVGLSWSSQKDGTGEERVPGTVEEGLETS